MGASATTPAKPQPSNGKCTKYKVTASTLNVRKGPSTSYPRIGTLKYNAQVCVYQVVNGFGKLDNGYASMTYLSTIRNDVIADPPAGNGKGKVIFIGDSRTVGMHAAVGEPANTVWSAKVSMGYDWMVSTGVPNIEGKVSSGSKIVILMGVNDFGYNNRAQKYANYINTKAAEWAKKGAKTYYCSVNPVIDSKTSKYVKNKGIQEFNKAIKPLLKGVTYIDTYNKIVNNFGSADGLHYDKTTYVTIYNFILSKI